MRLIITLEPLVDLDYDYIKKHTLQGLIYSLLSDTGYKSLHESNRFKFFCFSDIFPIGDFRRGEQKRLLVSSPDKGFINALHDSIKDKKLVDIGHYSFKLSSRKVELGLKRRFITGSPVVLYKDNQTNTYFSFSRDGDLSFFLDRVKENALKKYNAFYCDEFSFEGPVFDRLHFKRDVVVSNIKDGNEYIVIGSTWNLLEKLEMDREERRFYTFLMDCGLGEKNSAGFGFLNPVRGDGA